MPHLSMVDFDKKMQEVRDKHVKPAESPLRQLIRNKSLVVRRKV